jgi:5-methylcytosine-specific restriction protein A
MQLLSDELPTAGTYNEGARSLVLVNRFERNRAARVACIAHFGARCMICDFDFERVYGSVGQGFIHTHHLIPISEIDDEYEIDPIKDLAPVCANCHAMIHARRVPYTIREIASLMKIAKSGRKLS